MPATCPSPRRKAGAAFRPKASPRVCGRSRGVFRNPDSVNSFGFIFLPFTIQHPASAGRAPENSALRRFSVPRFAPSTSSAQIIGICLYAAMRSAGASLWRLTKPPFLPRMGDSFFREERSKGRTKSTGADFVRGRLFAAHPATPEIGKKMLPASKIPGGYSRPMPRLCRGEFYGQRASENSGISIARCPPDALRTSGFQRTKARLRKRNLTRRGALRLAPLRVAFTSAEFRLIL